MTNNLKNHEIQLYNNILLLTRNKLLYTKFNLSDTFQNRINLIFIHISFLFIKLKQTKNQKEYKEFQQRMFDLIFKKIEENMREIGYGDVTVNKNMKFLVKTFYNVLLDCEKYNSYNQDSKVLFLNKYFDIKSDKNGTDNAGIIGYFNKYYSFCLDLSSDSVLQGKLNFNY